MAWQVRPAQPGDRDSILALVEEAFTGADRDGHEEVDIVTATWRLGASPDGLELVAADDGAVVGHVLAARGDLAGETVVAVAPLAVAPAVHGRGIGTALMTELLRRAEAQGWRAVVLLGAPAYYGRFGFEPSGPLGIVYPPVGPDNPHFQVRRLPGFAPSLRGEFTYCWEGSEA
jgi:predicted N-acetyltransferase YhbS